MANPTCSKGPSQSVAVILPCYRETSHILSVINKIGPEVLAIYVVDDACPDLTGAFVQDYCIYCEDGIINSKQCDAYMTFVVNSTDTVHVLITAEVEQGAAFM